MKRLALLIFTVVNLGSCAPTQTTNAPPAPTISVASPSPLPSPARKPLQAKQIEKRWSSKFEFVTRSIDFGHTGIRGYEISVDYPEIKEKTSHAQRFNRWMKRKIQGDFRQFKWLQQRAEAQDRRRKLEPASITEALRIWFDVYYADEELISLRLTHSVMAIGQMHPINYYETLNYDLDRGTTLSQEDIFRSGYLKVFSRYSRAFVRNNYEMTCTTEDWLESGTEAKRRNFPNWNIVPDGILIAFEDYQIGSHSFGQLELIIPFSELKAVLKPKTVITRFL